MSLSVRSGAYREIAFVASVVPPNFIPMLPSLVTQGLQAFWTNPLPTQVRVLQSAYFHLNAANVVSQNLEGCFAHLIEHIQSQDKSANDQNGQLDFWSINSAWSRFQKPNSENPAPPVAGAKPGTNPPSPPPARGSNPGGLSRERQTPLGRHAMIAGGAPLEAVLQRASSGVPETPRHAFWSTWPASVISIIDRELDTKSLDRDLEKTNPEVLATIIARAVIQSLRQLEELWTQVTESEEGAVERFSSHLSLMRLLLQHFNKALKEDDELLMETWRRVAQSSEIMTALRRLSLRLSKGILDEVVKAKVDHLVYLFDLGFLLYVLRLHRGQADSLAPAVSGVRTEELKGRILAEKLMSVMEKFPASEKSFSDTNGADFSEIEQILVILSREVRNNSEESTILKSFFSNLNRIEFLRLLSMMYWLRRTD